jgi:hypothetical protein
MNQAPKGVEGDDTGLRGKPVLLKDSGMNFVTMDFDGSRSLNTQTHLASLHPQHDDPDIGSYRNAFSAAPCQNQHGILSDTLSACRHGT